MNFAEMDGTPRGTAPWYGAVLPRGITFTRFGGNRLSAFDWVTGYSNVGTDGGRENDRYLALSGNGAWDYGTAPGAAVAGRIEAARLRGRALMLTIPMLGSVAAPGSGHFKPSMPRKGAPFVVPTGAEPVVYQDELVDFVRQRVAEHTPPPPNPRVLRPRQRTRPLELHPSGGGQGDVVLRGVQ